MNKITRIVTVIKKLTLKMHVELIKDKPDGTSTHFYNVFTFGSKTYGRIDVHPYLTLEITDGTEWSKDKNILLDARTIYNLIRGIEKSLKMIYDGNVFVMGTSGKVILNKEVLEEHTVRVFNINNNGIIIRPAVIYDENEITYEGVLFYMNNTHNYVELDIDSLHALCYNLKKVDLFLYSQSMVNYYLSTLKTGPQVTPTAIDKPTPKEKRANAFAFEKASVGGNLVNNSNPLSDYKSSN